MTILHALAGDVDTAGLRAMLDDFLRACPETEIQEEGYGDLESITRTCIAAGNPPDIVLHPQPGLVRESWEQGFAGSLEEVVDVDRLRRQAVPDVVDTMTFDGRLVGVPVRVSPKSLVWYSPRTFAEGGYQVPRTWEELMALTRAMADDDVVAAPWCIGIESRSATGWVVTDRVEDILLRAHGPQVYDAWAEGELAFDTPQVRDAIEGYLEPIWFNEDFVLGGRSAITEVSFADAVLGLNQDSQGRGLHRQAGFIEGCMDVGLQYGVDHAVFLPSIDAAHGTPMLGAEDFAVRYTDNPAANTLLAWMGRPEAGEAWAANGSSVSAFGNALDDTAYGRPLDRTLHEFCSVASLYRFEASDQIPAPAGAGAFWEQMTRWVDGDQELRSALAGIDRVFSAGR